MRPLDILAAFGATLCWGIGDFIIQYVTRRIGDLETLTLIGLFGSVALLPYVWAELPAVLGPSSSLMLLALGIITFAIGILNFEALRRGRISVVEVILTAELPVAVLFGMVCLAEFPSVFQLCLIGLVFVGILFLAVEPNEIKGIHFLEKGVVFALIAAFGYGVIDFLTTVESRAISPITAIWCPWLILTVMCFLSLLWNGKLGLLFKKAMKYKWLVSSMCIIDTLAWLLFAIVAARSELATSVAITESYPAIGLILGVTVNHEKIAARQYCGAAIAIAATIAMGLYVR
jgi:drug/metabolite transporter (DMT)-like permease